MPTLFSMQGGALPSTSAPLDDEFGGVGDFRYIRDSLSTTQRVSVTDPFGASTEVLCADGEPLTVDDKYNGAYSIINVPVQEEMSYRMSVWVRLTHLVDDAEEDTYDPAIGGRILFGSAREGTTTLSGEATPDGWHSGWSFYPPVNEWVLLVAYMHSTEVSATPASSQGGCFRQNGERFRVFEDFVLNSGTTSQEMKFFYYGSTDGEYAAYFYAPRFDALDGAEPTVGEMLRSPAYRAVANEFTIVRYSVRGNLGDANAEQLAVSGNTELNETTVYSNLHVEGNTIVEGSSVLQDGLTVTGSTDLDTVTAGTWNGSTVEVNYGGTGATTAAGALYNLGVPINESSEWVGEPIHVSHGGTGATTFEGARDNLGIPIGFRDTGLTGASLFTDLLADDTGYVNLSANSHYYAWKQSIETNTTITLPSASVANKGDWITVFYIHAIDDSITHVYEAPDGEYLALGSHCMRLGGAVASSADMLFEQRARKLILTGDANGDGGQGTVVKFIMTTVGDTNGWVAQAVTTNQGDGTSPGTIEFYEYENAA